MKNFFLQRWKRIEWALSGMYEFFRSEVHARIHLFFIVAVLVMGWYFRLSALEWMFVLISIGIVVLAEIINTLIEKIMDFVHPGFHPKVKVIKDMGAAAVLWAALIAAIIGSIVFLPKMF